MGRAVNGLLIGIGIVALVSGCRALSNDGSPGAQPSGPAPATQEPKPVLAPPAANETKSIDNKDVFDVWVLREALGQTLLPLIDGQLVTFQKNPAKKEAQDPNFSMESGKLEFNQTLQGEGGGQAKIHGGGGYQKLTSVSGETILYAHPATIDFNFNKLQIKSECYNTMTLAGKVRCSLSATYTHGSHTLVGSGQCMTHNNGILDNLNLDIAGSPHKVRYVLGFKVNGNPGDWRAYQWVGVAFVSGLKTDLTPLNDLQNTCSK